jgi:NNP family nitrate/nitrite transporter-like MFS transporter
VVVLVLAMGLAGSYESIVPLTVCCLTMALALGVGTGAVFKLVPVWYPKKVGAVTGVVGAAGGLGGFFPPLVMGVVKTATGGYAVGFVRMGAVALACLLVLAGLRGATVRADEVLRRGSPPLTGSGAGTA